MLKGNQNLVLFSLGSGKYALALTSVETVIRAVEVRPLPGAPDIVEGVIDFHGRVLPVFNVRRRFGLPERPMTTDDHMIIARTRRWAVSLAVEDAPSLLELDASGIMPSSNILPEMKYVSGVTTIDGGIVLIHDLDTFLCLEEQETLDRALKDRAKEK